MSMTLFVFIRLSLSVRTFTVQGNNFLKDGQPYRYVSGSYHYFRDTPECWEDRIRKMAAGGLNAVQTYVAWNIHEPIPGNFTWTGSANIELFVDLCAKYNLSVILRPGPYICAEWAIGGLPYWLENVAGMDTAFRTVSPLFMNYVDRFWTSLFQRLRPKLYVNGGPIILVQVENEYGNFGCDSSYLNALADLIVKGLGSDTVLITADNPSESKLKCGSLPGRAIITLNFGPGHDPRPYYEMARTAMGGSGPLVTSEYWTDYGNNSIPQWGTAFPRHTGAEIAQWLDRQLALGASVNMYMYYGGSNFMYEGALGGTEFGDNYRAFLPSYDYDAPLTESGDITDKFLKVREVIAKYFKVQPIAVKESPKLAFGPISFTQSVAFFDGAPVFGLKYIPDPLNMNLSQRTRILTFEQVHMPYDLVLYSVVAPTSGLFSAYVYDYGVLMLKNNGRLIAKAVRPNPLTVTVAKSDRISILVSGLGRLNAGPNMTKDRKGLRKATIEGVDVEDWEVETIPLYSFSVKVDWKTNLVVGGPAFYRAVFEVDEPADTFFNGAGFDCAIVFVNGVRIGRVWRIGPQVTLYVRAQFLKKGTNELVVFETGAITKVPVVTFDSKPILDGPVIPITEA